MRSLQTAGGIAAIVQALAYVAGFAVLATVLDPADVTAADRLAFMLERKALVRAWILVIYVVFGIALVVLCIALHERLKHAASATMQVASAFGLIWAGLVIASGMVASVGLTAVAKLASQDPALALALSTWTTLGVVQDGVGGGVEVVGGLWALLVSVAAWHAWPRALGCSGSRSASPASRRWRRL